MTIKTGGTIIGAVVQNLPIVIDGQKSIYEEGLKNGTLPASMTFKQFLDMLSVGVTDDEVDKKVAAAVSAEFIRLGLVNKNGKPPIEQSGNATTKPAEQGNTAPVQVVDKGKVNASKDIYAMENILVGGNIIGANMGVGFRKSHKETKPFVDVSNLKEYTHADVVKILDEANAAKGVAKFPAGVFKLNKGIRFNSTSFPNVKGIEGDGMGRTVFIGEYEQTERWNANTNLTDARPQSVIVVEGKDGFTTKNCTIWYKGTFYWSPKDYPGNIFTSYFGSVHGLMYDATTNGVIDGVEVLGANRCGIICSATGDEINKQNAKWYKGEITKDGLTAHGRGNVVKNCFSHHNRVAGIMGQNQVDMQAFNNSAHFNGHEKDGGTGYGIVLASGSVNVDCVITENLVERNFRKGLDVHDAYTSEFRNNTSRGNRFFGVAIEGRGYPMAKCYVTRNVIIQDPEFRLALDDEHAKWEDHKNSDYYRYCGIRFEINPQAVDQTYKVPDVVDLQATDNYISGIDWDGRGAHQAFIMLNREDDIRSKIKFTLTGNIVKGKRVTNVVFAKGYESSVQGVGEFIFENNQIHFDEVTDVPLYFEEKGTSGEINQAIRVRNNLIEIAKSSGWVGLFDLESETRKGINEFIGNTISVGEVGESFIRLNSKAAAQSLKIVVKDNVWTKQTANALSPAALMNETNVPRANVTWDNNRVTDKTGTEVTIPNTAKSVPTAPTPSNASPTPTVPTTGWDAAYKRPAAQGSAPLPTITLNWDAATDDTVPNKTGTGGLVKAGEYQPKEGWTHLIDKTASPKFAKARFQSEGASAGVYPRWNLGTTNTAGRSTIVFPFRINSLGTSRRAESGLNMLGAGTINGQAETEIGGGAVAVRGSSDTKFKFSKTGFHIDGVLYDGSDLTLGKTYVMAIALEPNASFITLGARANGNGQVDGDFFEGAEFYSTSLSPTDRVNASLRVMDLIAAGGKKTEVPQPSESSSRGNGQVVAGTPTEAQPLATDSSNGQGSTATTQPTTPVVPASTTPSPVTPANPPENSDQAQSQPAAKPETSIKFTFDGVEATSAEAVGSNGAAKLKTLNSAPRAGEPEGWVGAFGMDGSHKVMLASAAGAENGTRYIDSDGISSDGTTDTAFIVPIKVSSVASNGGSFAAVVLSGRNIVNSGLLVTDAEGGFTLRAVDGTSIDGKPITAGEAYAYDKWHVAVITVKAGADRAFDKIRFGSNQNGNSSRSLTIGAGFEVLQGDISKAAAKAAELMKEYGVATS